MNEKEEVLRSVINELLKHRKVMEDFNIQMEVPLQIKRGDTTPKNIKKIFMLDIQSRARPLRIERYKEVLREFETRVVYELINIAKSDADCQEKVNQMIERCRSIDGIGPKISALFLKTAVFYYELWRDLLPYLYQPIDFHLRDILSQNESGKGLKVIDKEDIPGTSEPFTTKKNEKFQAWLGKIHTPRVEFDYLWYIGHVFCSRHMPFVCDQLCWIRQWCRN